eukprot:CAMPEP_0117501538 /NCGR_PEP_ID=MMETSP0784-20121206/23350_1 /TAXON_ID=39447 /ORGANISM="" /LENGTH=329 /DNA_ID=CAMNT_0005296795 /DNA_START=61 /DNA_END=1050 /DNA_ORIENTATION=+
MNLVVSVILNSRSDDATPHAIYVNNFSVFLGGVMLVPRAVFSPAPCRKPTYWWSLLGGIYSIPGFVGIPAGNMMGVQVVLLVQLFAMLSTALAFDFRRGHVQLTDMKQLGGFCVVIAGVVVDNASSMSFSGPNVLVSLILLLLVFSSGVGYGLQAKCNGRLARDVGSSSRATIISAIVCLVATAPVNAYLCWGDGVQPRFRWNDWYFWAFAGFQSAFYIGSLAKLPQYLGYTTSYLVLLVGKLGSSTVVDAMGVTGKTVPFGALRAMSLVLVFIGTALFSGKAQPGPQPDVDGVPVDLSFTAGPDGAETEQTKRRADGEALALEVPLGS